MVDLNLKPIGTVQSALIKREDCPLQGDEGAPEAWLKIDKEFLAWTSRSESWQRNYFTDLVSFG